MIKIDSNIGFVVFNGENIGTLNSSELAIITYLIKREGQIVSKDELLIVGWPNRIVVSNSVNMAIRNIRAVFTRVTKKQVILTLPREGYKLIPGEVSLIPETEVRENNADSVGTAKPITTIIVDFLRRINGVSYYWIVFFIISIILWVSLFNLISLDRELACVNLRDKVVCATKGVDLSQDVLKNAPSGGIYIYGIDPISGEKVYERKD